MALCGFEPQGIMKPGKSGWIYCSPAHPGLPLFPCKRCGKKAVCK